MKLLPAAYVRAYVKRNKTDAADACALIEAARCVDITPVKVKSIEQQAVQGLHRIRSLWMGTRTSRINALRGLCREFGIVIAQGSRVGVEQISRVLADPHSAVPTLIRGTMKLLIEEIRLLEARSGELERELSELARQSPACTTLLSIPGHRPAHRHGDGGSDRRGSRPLQGRAPLRFLVRAHAQGAFFRKHALFGAHFEKGRSLPAYAARARRALAARKPQWHAERDVQQRTNHNKAACALANKLARICFACMREGAPYATPRTRLTKKIERAAFPLPA